MTDERDFYERHIHMLKKIRQMAESDQSNPRYQDKRNQSRLRRVLSGLDKEQAHVEMKLANLKGA